MGEGDDGVCDIYAEEGGGVGGEKPVSAASVGVGGRCYRALM